jgi:hypothetical protein
MVLILVPPGIRIAVEAECKRKPRRPSARFAAARA